MHPEHASPRATPSVASSYDLSPCRDLRVRVRCPFCAGPSSDALLKKKMSLESEAYVFGQYRREQEAIRFGTTTSQTKFVFGTTTPQTEFCFSFAEVDQSYSQLCGQKDSKERKASRKYARRAQDKLNHAGSDKLNHAGSDKLNHAVSDKPNFAGLSFEEQRWKYVSNATPESRIAELELQIMTLAKQAKELKVQNGMLTTEKARMKAELQDSDKRMQQNREEIAALKDQHQRVRDMYEVLKIEHEREKDRNARLYQDLQNVWRRSGETWKARYMELYWINAGYTECVLRTTEDDRNNVCSVTRDIAEAIPLWAPFELPTTVKVLQTFRNFRLSLCDPGLRRAFITGLTLVEMQEWLLFHVSIKDAVGLTQIFEVVIECECVDKYMSMLTCTRNVHFWVWTKLTDPIREACAKLSAVRFECVRLVLASSKTDAEMIKNVKQLSLEDLNDAMSKLSAKVSMSARRDWPDNARMTTLIGMYARGRATEDEMPLIDEYVVEWQRAHLLHRLIDFFEKLEATPIVDFLYSRMSEHVESYFENCIDFVRYYIPTDRLVRAFAEWQKRKWECALPCLEKWACTRSFEDVRLLVYKCLHLQRLSPEELKHAACYGTLSRVWDDATVREMVRDSLRLQLDEGVPDDYKCPITLQIMRDPVSTHDGHTYERFAIAEHFKHSFSSPKTGQLLPNQRVVPNWSLKNCIAAYVDANMPQTTLDRIMKSLVRPVDAEVCAQPDGTVRLRLVL